MGAHRLVTLLAVLVTAAPVVATTGAAGVQPADDRRARAATLSITGSGYGHGHGLSQWGAQGAASAGLSHRRILRFYYPGLRSGTAHGPVAVLISGDTSDDLVVLDRADLTVRSRGSGRRLDLDRPAAARQWRITAVAGGRRSAVAWRGRRGGWTTLRTLPGQAEFSARGRPITLVTPTERRAYRGALRSAAPTASSARRDTVNVVGLDAYLKGVVPREVFASWEPAALRAQAVAARTYAAFDRRDANAPHYQICDTTQCQVYGGATDEVASTSRAIDATRGQVLTTADGRPAFTQFSASNGGYTAAGSQPYLVARTDPYDTAYVDWDDTVTAGELERAFPGNGAFRSAEVLERDGNGRYGGRVVRIRLTFADRSTVISGDTFRSYVGLRSDLFQLR